MDEGTNCLTFVDSACVSRQKLTQRSVQRSSLFGNPWWIFRQQRGSRPHDRKGPNAPQRLPQGTCYHKYLQHITNILNKPFER